MKERKRYRVPKTSAGSGPKHRCFDPTHVWKGEPRTKGSFCRTCKRKVDNARGHAQRRARGLKKREACTNAAHDHRPGGCRTCKQADARKRAKERYSTEEHRERTYGLTAAEQAALFADAKHTCQICHAKPATHIDHDHATGLIRGVLCPGCNLNLGILESAWAAKAAAYLFERT